MVAFFFIMLDKMSAETSYWAKDSNKHYNISKINSIHFFKIKQILNPTFSLFEEKKQLENIFRNIQFPSKYTTKLYILYCELKFEVTSLPSNSLGVNWLLYLQYASQGLLKVVFSTTSTVLLDFFQLNKRGLT
ncbi:MAG: hypothetical protein A2X64_07280 [Ignavibacteria bacterium GWF2_33_9]|nr:MAG: hypothetical protein A2X64_07280 [Ignavibacteria bacterium GWF2_33_9]